MTRNPLERGADRPEPASGTGALQRFQAAHQATRRHYRAMTLGLVGIGGALAAAGFTGLLPLVPALLVGVVTMAVAIFPFCEMIERGERIEGLAVLQQEWQMSTRADSGTAAADERLGGLLDQLYGGR